MIVTPFPAREQREKAVMKIVGLIFVIVGIVAAVNAINAPAVTQGSDGYKKGVKLGRGSAPVVLIGLGLGLLLRRSGSGSASSRPASTSRYTPQPALPPAYPAAMPVRIQCSCGQLYEFEVEPVAGRMPHLVACPACGVDGTEAANASIAQTLAERAATPAWSQPAPSRRRFHPALLVGIGVVALVFLLLAASLVSRLIRFNRARTNRPLTYPSETVRPNVPPTATPGATGGQARPPSKPGSARDAAPVPSDVTSVDVLWGGRWYEATILRRQGERTLIHYDGWGSNFDEWVTPDRLRPRR
jgi:hypothetical protein